MAIHFRQTETELIIIGQTFPYREAIKALGGTFNGSNKTWIVPKNAATVERVFRLCRAAGGGPLDEPASPNGPASSSMPPPLAAPSSALVPSNTLTIRQLFDSISRTIAQTYARPIWLMGEAHNVSERPSGIFMDLSEPKSQGGATITARAIIWRNELDALCQRRGQEAIRGILADGLTLRCLCQVSFYQDRGQISLTIRDIDPSVTKGALALAREELLRKLRRQGLDRMNASRELTRFPLTVGLISAEGSRAKSDFLHQLYSLGFPGQILFFPSPMQGEKTWRGVESGIAALVRRNVDLIVITRGGGSAADLRWFDEEKIALAIAHSPVPVIAAIGHHDDLSVAEQVAYHREKTPTAAAEFILRRIHDTGREVENAIHGLARAVAAALEQFDELCQRLRLEITTRSMGQLEKKNRWLYQFADTLSQKLRNRLQQNDHLLIELKHALHRNALDQLTSTRDLLAQLEKQLIQKNPKPWIEQGWTQLLSHTGRVLSIDDVTTDQILHTRLKDGRLELKVVGKSGLKPLRNKVDSK